MLFMFCKGLLSNNSVISADSAFKFCTDSAHFAVWLRRVPCRLKLWPIMEHLQVLNIRKPPISFGSSDTCNSGHTHICYCQCWLHMQMSKLANLTTWVDLGITSWTSSLGWNVAHLANQVTNASWGMYVSSSARSHHKLLERNVGANFKICWNK